MNEIKLGQGKTLQAFIKETQCYSEDLTSHAPCASLEAFEETEIVEYKGTPIYGNNPDYPNLSSFMVQYIDEILKQVETFFPTKFAQNTNRAKLDMSIFQPLYQRIWPTKDEDKKTFSPGSIKQLATALNLNYNAKLQKEYDELVRKILLDKSLFCSDKKSDPLIFWITVLKSYKNDISEDLQHLIMSANILPMSSADSERR